MTDQDSLDGRVRDLQAAVDLFDVRPISFTAKVTGTAPPEGAKIALGLRTLVDAQRMPDSQRMFQVLGKFSLSVRAGTEEETPPPEASPFVRFRYEVLASYNNLHPDFSDEVLHRFAETNGMIHLWPYFRTYVSSSLGQLGLTPFPLPVWRVPKPPLTKQSKK